MDDVYKAYYKSEQILLQLLGLLSVTCLIISTFGLFSLVTLTSEQRRKEIAIRKINGASILNILNIFFKEYCILLIVSATIAFSVGHLLIKPWIESFVKQTEINWWVYILIILFIVLVIGVSVFSRIWKAARSNPATVIKIE